VSHSRKNPIARADEPSSASPNIPQDDRIKFGCGFNEPGR